VVEASVRSVYEAEAVSPWLHLQSGVCCAVDYDGVGEKLRNRGCRLWERTIWKCAPPSGQGTRKVGERHRRSLIARRVLRPFVLPGIPTAPWFWWLGHNARFPISGIIAPRALPEGLILEDEWNPEPVAPVRNTAKVRVGQHAFFKQL